jgi:hypothetical protein
MPFVVVARVRDAGEAKVADFQVAVHVDEDVA